MLKLQKRDVKLEKNKQIFRSLNILYKLKKFTEEPNKHRTEQKPNKKHSKIIWHDQA